MKLASPGRVVANTLVVAFIAWWAIAGFTSADATAPTELFDRTVALATGNPLISVPVVLGAVAFVLFGNSGGSNGGVDIQLGQR